MRCTDRRKFNVCLEHAAGPSRTRCAQDCVNFGYISLVIPYSTVIVNLINKTEIKWKLSSGDVSTTDKTGARGLCGLNSICSQVRVCYGYSSPISLMDDPRTLLL
jgi:hypothetical protein